MKAVFKQITPDMRREISGVLLVALGMLGYLSLALPHAGALGGDLRRGLTVIFGLIKWAVPLSVIAAGVARIRRQPSWTGHRRGWGILCLYFGLATFLGWHSLAWGGWIGHQLLIEMQKLVGTAGAVMVAVTAMVVGLMLATDTSLARAIGYGARAVQWMVHRLLPVLTKAWRGLANWLTVDEAKRGEVEQPKRGRGRPRSSKALASVPAEERARVQAVASPSASREAAAPEFVQPPVFSRGDQPYLPPPLTLLAEPAPGAATHAKADPMQRAQVLQAALKQFGIDVRLGEVSQGPTITRFEIIPPPGVKVSRIVNLADDIALSLAATGVRIEAPIPGKSAIGIEVPNEQVTPVLLREVIESRAFAESQSPLTVALGRDVAGVPVVAQLEQMPHLLVAGATGSGKSVLINVLITSLLYRSSPDVVRLLLIDPKVVELSVYNGIPHLINPVVTDPKKAAAALRWAVVEMERRYQLFAQAGVRDITRYNLRTDEHLPLIVVLIDELADLMMVAPADVEESIARLAQMARAAGLHLVVATQRPSVDVITGTIKANIPSRIAFAVSSQVDSRTILDTTGAEKLVGRGDMLFAPVGAAKPLRVQGALVTEREIDAIVSYLKEHSPTASSPAPELGDLTSDEFSRTAADDDEDPLFLAALRTVVESRQASTSMLQRRLRIGYARAARLIDALEARGAIGPADGAKPREVYWTVQQFQEQYPQDRSTS